MWLNNENCHYHVTNIFFLFIFCILFKSSDLRPKLVASMVQWPIVISGNQTRARCTIASSESGLSPLTTRPLDIQIIMTINELFQYYNIKEKQGPLRFLSSRYSNYVTEVIIIKCSILDVLVLWCQNQHFSTNINLKIPNNNTYNTRVDTNKFIICHNKKCTENCRWKWLSIWKNTMQLFFRKLTASRRI